MAHTQEPTADRPVVSRIGRFADRDAFTAEGWCKLERTLELVGTRSAMILLREAFYGGRRFDELARRTGLSDAVAAKRLKQLVDDGLLRQQPYQEPGSRTRQEYVLTERGRTLFPVVVAMMSWGATLEGREGGVELVHAECGEPLTAVVRCAAGHDVGIEDAAAQTIREGRKARRS
ncbi:helix-turn-helix domain-containing protein [Amycolatopsis rhabdoformis]|uniref:Helix-turn-helix domain-containing protein n=1 Tax=Amycolatopsis rhabdoformis TaxID=1448059 RepID=A0ABZ1HXF2_9PSEU|nr:helix-turn-helix domain-containing protein [Amycolatopsis rhabdoformis]WSE26201.1 helix-turn-helix domain-containing protein [Amycolatopsis rhabdoformis]